jgi:hypothetical protein
VNPEAYLRNTLTKIAEGHPINKIDQLMPWRMSASDPKQPDEQRAWLPVPIANPCIITHRRSFALHAVDDTLTRSQPSHD